jgi:hypothetical protein
MDINTETPSVETPSTEVSSEVGSQSTLSPEISSPVVEEVFTPNYKYKAYGKELEMDEWARPLLNKDTQPHLTKLFEKAGGFEPLKERYSHTEQELGNYRNAYSALDGVRNQILADISKGSLGNVFKVLGVTSQQVRDFVKQELTYESLPPEERRKIDEQNHVRQQNEFYQQQLQEQRSMSEQLVMQKHELDIQMTFSNPKYSPLIASYNQRMGSGQAFRDAVDRIGNYEWTINQRSITPSEAVEQAIKMLGLSVEQPMNGGQQVNQPQSLPGKPAPKPIIVPNGSSSTPVKKRPASIADLEKEYQQMMNTTN